MNEQQKRYLKLDGSPIHMKGLRSTLHTPHVQTGLLATAFNMAVTSATAPEITLVRMAADLIMMGLFCSAYSWLDRNGGKEIFGPNHTNLAIDKMPDNNTPPTSPTNLSASHAFRNTGLVSAATMAVVAYAFNLFDSLPVVPAGASIVWGHSLSKAYRFNKVVKEEWNIVEMPKPQKQEEKASVTAPQLT